MPDLGEVNITPVHEDIPSFFIDDFLQPGIISPEMDLDDPVHLALVEVPAEKGEIKIKPHSHRAYYAA